MSPRLKVCTAEDLDALVGVSATTFIESFADQNAQEDIDEYVQRSFTQERLAAELGQPQSMFFLALVDGDVAGYLKINVGGAQTEDMGDNALEVERIYALHRFQGRGLGRLMMDRAISEASSRGLKKVWLGVWEHNDSARSFYEHRGFVVTGSHIFHLGSEEQTDLIMELAV